MTARNLRIVGQDKHHAALVAASAAAGEHISDLLRADAKRFNAARVHVAADRRAPVYLEDRPRRTWTSWARR